MDIEQMKDKMWYLAHPYTAPHSADIRKNVINANKIAAQLISKGIIVFSPISMTHYIHLQGVLEGYWEYEEQNLWYEFDEHFMEKCDGIILAGDWQNSKGCKAEKNWFLERIKPVVVLEDIKGL
jgi:hypothetical protein